MTHRRAHSLLELLAFMSIGSTVLLLAIGMIHRAMSLESSSRTYARAHATATRLATQFRSDVHRATKAQLESEKAKDDSLLRLTLPDRQEVVYTIAKHSILRLQTGDGQDRRETFTFPESFFAKLALPSNPRRCTLHVAKKTEFQRSPPRVELHVEAVVARLSQEINFEEDTP